MCILSNECYCGNVFGTYGLAINSGYSCNMPCTGNSNEICGGGNANSIYLTSIPSKDGILSLKNEYVYARF